MASPIKEAALRHHAGASVGLLRKAQRTVLELAGLEKSLARARQDLIEAARARRVLEILRERRLAAFRADEARRERDQLDEFAQEIDRRAKLGHGTTDERGAA